jgi:putative transposase
VPGYPHHVIQRGNNGQPIFSRLADYQFMLGQLAEHARKFEVAVHAYVLMGNHFHLLATPSTADGLPPMMQAIGRHYVRYFNDLQKRSGTLWEGRYKSTVVQPELYLLNCMVCFDLNPVRAGLVNQAGDYPWSSYGHYAGQRVDPLVTPHALYWSLGNTPFSREAAYTEMVHSGISQAQQSELTDSARYGWLLGDSDFVVDLQKKTERRLTKSRAGRPNSNAK